MRRIDHAAIEQALLDDPTRSCRSIADEFGISDWSVRAIVRRLNNDPRPMKSPRHKARNDEAAGVGGWAILAAIDAAAIGLIAWAARRPPEDQNNGG
jgi:hypothetical protein